MLEADGHKEDLDAGETFNGLGDLHRGAFLITLILIWVQVINFHLQSRGLSNRVRSLETDCHALIKAGVGVLKMPLLEKAERH